MTCTLNINWETRAGPETLKGIIIPDEPDEESIEKIYRALETLYGDKPRYFTWEKEKNPEA